ncbi:MAG TPA: tryptophan synthase subunit alpha [Cyclobacteriaceae bacterium]|nr:tryptophan synthase subunit alpha [Cyclobacteriaceae bacterium]
MMNKIEQLFSDRSNGKLSVYFTAGFPKLNDTAPVMKALQESGADIIEVGIPFSDPVADGPTIQSSNKQALGNGIGLKLILQQIKSVSAEMKIPVILMGYLNPVFQYGIEKFCRDAADAGVSGVIIPDLPLQEFRDMYADVFEKYDLLNIFLVTPQTSEARIRMIDQLSRGFIYLVSASSTTGARNGLSQEQISYFSRIGGMKLVNPKLIGFGISDHSTFLTACRYAEGAIIGSAFIRMLERSNDLEHDIRKYIYSVKGIN